MGYLIVCQKKPYIRLQISWEEDEGWKKNSNTCSLLREEMSQLVMIKHKSLILTSFLFSWYKKKIWKKVHKIMQSLQKDSMYILPQIEIFFLDLSRIYGKHSVKNGRKNFDIFTLSFSKWGNPEQDNSMSYCSKFLFSHSEDNREVISKSCRSLPYFYILLGFSTLRRSKS